MFGGIHFSLAVCAFALIDVPSEKIDGELYAMDLIGSAGGVLIVTLFVVPILGDYEYPDSAQSTIISVLTDIDAPALMDRVITCRTGKNCF